MSHTLVSLKKKPSSCGAEQTLGAKLSQGPIADKCFTLAALGSLSGMGYLGAHLWLMRSSIIPTTASYALFRELHIYQQLFFFFGLVILGFAIQSAPRFLGLEKPIPPAIRLSPVGLILVAWVLLYAIGTQFATKIFLSTAFFMVFCFIGVRIVLQRRFTPPLFLLLVSMLTFCVGAFTQWSNPGDAIGFFWLAVGGPLLGFSQIFIGNLLGGHSLTKQSNIAVLILFLVSGFCNFFQIYLPSFLLLAYYCFATRFITINPSKINLHKNIQVRIAFSFGYAWALIGAFLLILSPSYADYAFHVWAIGWGTSIVIGMTSHIISFLSGLEGPKKILSVGLVLWQFVPLERGLGNLLSLPPQLSIVTVLCALLSLVIWTYLLMQAEYKILVRQWYATAGEPMVQEA